MMKLDYTISLFSIVVISVTFILMLFSCTKEKVYIPENCTGIDAVLEIIGGRDLRFKNLKTNKRKIFSYNPELSSKRDFFCDPADRTGLSRFTFTTNNGDTIGYVLDYNTNSLRFNWSHFGSTIFGEYRNSVIKKEDKKYALTFFSNENLPDRLDNKFIGFGDSDGNRWLLDDENSDIFYCEIIDNYTSFDFTKRNEYQLVENFSSESVFQSGDSLETWNVELGFSEGFIPRIDSSCIGNRLTLDPAFSARLRMKRIDHSIIELTIYEEFNYALDPDEYLYIRIDGLYQTLCKRSDSNPCTYYSNWFNIVNDPSYFGSNESLLSPYVFHDHYILNDKEVKNVYGIGPDMKKIFFNNDLGILAYHDRDSSLFTLVFE